MVAVLFDAESGTSGTTLTTGNSGFNAVATAGGGAIFSSAAAAHGSLGYRFTEAAGHSNVRIDTFQSSASRIRCGFAIRISASPSAALQVSYWTDAANATLLPRIIINTNRTLGIQNAANGTLFTTATALALNTWYRVELVWIPGATTTTGTIGFGLALLDDPINSGGSDYYYATNVNTGTADGVGRWTLPKLSGTWNATVDLDDIIADDTTFTSDPATWLGPQGSVIVAAALSGSGTLSASAGSPAITTAAALSGSGSLTATGIRDGLSVDSTAHGGGTAGTSFGSAFVAPTAGQLELVLATCANTVTITAPAGETWTTEVNVNPDRRQYLFSRIVPGSPTNGLFGLSTSAAVAYTQLLISGHDPAAPIADATGTSSATASTSIVAPSVTSTRAKSLLVNYYAQLSTASPPTITPPGGQTTIDSNPVVSAYTTKTAIEDRPTAGATGTRTATSSLSQPTGSISFIVTPFLVSATASLSSAGTLAATSTKAVSQVAALGGSGTLSTTQTAAVARAAALSGSGSLTALTAPAVARTAALSGSGTLAAAGVPAASQVAALSGSGTLAGSTFGTVTAALSGSGTLSAGQVMAVARVAALSGAGALTAAQTVALVRAAALSGSGTLTAGANPGYIRAAALSGSGTLVARAIFRLAWWTGTVWARLVPKVWTGSTWADVPVTVVDD